LLLVGNDIVDLHEAGIAEKSKDRRFVSRVFTDQEQEILGRCDQPDLMLWTLWAAKETAYKVVSKTHPFPIFAWREFRTTLSEFSTLGGRGFRARVQTVYHKHRIQTDVSGDTEIIHAVGSQDSLQNNSSSKIYSKAERWDEQAWVQNDFTEAERESIRGADSALVRRSLKHDLAEKLQIHPQRLEIIRPAGPTKMGPPSLWLDHKPCGIDISLSHHGGWSFIGCCHSR